MKLIATLLLVPSLTLAQTAKPSPAATHPHAATASTHACVKEADLSPKIPALPPGSPCAKHLYTIISVPSIKLENISPMEGTDLAERLGIDSTSVSLDYVDSKVGTGELAAPHKYYSVNYTGYLVDGTVFDSSEKHGAPHTFPYGEHQVIPGWDTGLNGMHVGGKRRLYIPYQLAYGPNGRPPQIPAKAELIFDVELVSQSDKDPTPAAPKSSANSAPMGVPGSQPPPSSGKAAPASAPATPPTPSATPVPAPATATPPSPAGPK